MIGKLDSGINQMLNHLSMWMKKNCSGVLEQVITIVPDILTEPVNEMQAEYLTHLRSYLAKQSPEKSKQTTDIQDQIEPSVNLGSVARTLLTCTDNFISYLFDSGSITQYEVDIIMLQDNARKKMLDTLGWSLLVSLLYQRLIIVVISDLKDHLESDDKNLLQLLEVARVNRVIKARTRAEITKFVELRDKILSGIERMPLKPVFTMISLLQVLEIDK